METGSKNVSFKNGDEMSGQSRPDVSEEMPTITEIVRLYSYHLVMVDDVPDLTLEFIAKRSDGEEIKVDNKYLKVNNPLLLINWYESVVLDDFPL